eukprot:gene2322-501_t
MPKKVKKDKVRKEEVHEFEVERVVAQKKIEVPHRPIVLMSGNAHPWTVTRSPSPALACAPAHISLSHHVLPSAGTTPSSLILGLCPDPSPACSCPDVPTDKVDHEAMEQYRKGGGRGLYLPIGNLGLDLPLNRDRWEEFKRRVGGRTLDSLEEDSGGRMQPGKPPLLPIFVEYANGDANKDWWGAFPEDDKQDTVTKTDTPADSVKRVCDYKSGKSVTEWLQVMPGGPSETQASTVVTKYPSGHKKEVFYNKDVRLTWPMPKDDYVIQRREDQVGNLKVEQTKTKVVYEYKEPACTQESYPDGLVVRRFKDGDQNGQTEWEFPDGGKIIEFAGFCTHYHYTHDPCA